MAGVPQQRSGPGALEYCPMCMCVCMLGQFSVTLDGDMHVQKHYPSDLTAQYLPSIWGAKGRHFLSNS